MPLPRKIIPDWVFTSDPSGQMRPTASDRAQRGSKPIVIQTPTIADNTVIPIVYGGPERIAGMPYTCGLASNGVDLLVSFILCEGEIEQITNIEINNEALPAGVTFTAYAGTMTQGIDADLAAAIPGYDERHLGTAYLVGRFVPGAVNNLPNVTAEIYGRKILDRGMNGVTFAAAPANQYAKLAESAQNNIHGATNAEMIFVGTLANWSVSPTAQILISKWHHFNGLYSLQLQINAAGTLAAYYAASVYPFVPTNGFVAPVPVPLAGGQFGGVRVVMNVADHGKRTAQFYYSTDGVVWTALGSPVVSVNNLLPATPFDQAPWVGPATVVANGTLGGVAAWNLTDSDAANYQNRAVAIATTATPTVYHFGIRVKKTSTGGTAPTFVINASISGGTTVPGSSRINTDTGASMFFSARGGEVIDRGDHWEMRSSMASHAASTLVSFNIYPAMALNGDLVNLTPTATGTATISDMWLSAGIVDLGGVKWQVSSRSEGGEDYPPVGTVYSAVVKWGGVEHVRFNPEDAPAGAVTWPAPTGEAWTLVGASVQSRAAFASTNPAVILDDFMRTFGKRTVNAASVKNARNYCDALMTAGDKRSTLTITLAEGRNVDEWVEVLRQYIPGWVVFKENEWHIVVDAPSAPVLAYDADTDNRTDGEAPMVLVKRGVRDVPNVIEVGYTETSVKPWAEKKVTAELAGIGTGQIRKTPIALPGIRTRSQAYRFAVERLNHFTLEPIEGELAVFDDGIAILPGDIVTITDSAHGFAAKPVRVLRSDEKDNGRWAIRFREYNAGAYATDAPALPPPPDGGTLPNPLVVSAVTGLAASEVLRFEKNLDTNDGLARGLIWQSRIEATWTASTDSYLDFYEIAITGSTLTQPAVSTSKLPKFSSATLIQGTTYQVQVRIVNTLGIVGAWATVSLAVLGKVNPPSNVTVIDFAAEIGGEVILKWRAVPEADVVRYEWRALATSAATAPWDSMTLIDRPDTTYIRVKGLSPGPTLFAVKAIDSVGRFSDTPLYVSVTITSDLSSFLQSFDAIPNAGQEAWITKYEWPLVEGDTSRPLPRWITLGNSTWDAAMPNPVASVNTPVVSAFGQAGTPGISYPTWDWGTTLEAAIVSLDLSWIRLLGGNYTILQIAASLDGTNWTYPAYWAVVGTPLGKVTANITARFVRLVCYPQNPGVTWMQEGPIKMQVSSSTRKESGTGTSNATLGVPVTVNTANKYTRAVTITVTPKGTTAANPTVDNVVVGLSTTPNHFDVYIFNSAGGQISREFSWTFEGV